MTTGTHAHDTHTCPTCGAKPERATAAQRLELQRIELSVAGLSCAGDAAPLARWLEQLPGVREAMVNPVTERAVVVFDPGTVGIEAIIGVLEERGVDVGRTVARWRLKVPGLKCASCVRRIATPSSSKAWVPGSAPPGSSTPLSAMFSNGRPNRRPSRIAFCISSFSNTLSASDRCPNASCTNTPASEGLTTTG